MYTITSNYYFDKCYFEEKRLKKSADENVSLKSAFITKSNFMFNWMKWLYNNPATKASRPASLTL